MSHILPGALCLVLAASSIAAQDTARTRSDKRISISKGEVQLPRVDTVYITRTYTDTVVVYRPEFVRVPVTVIRTDTVEMPAKIIPKGNWYAGLFGGPTFPAGHIDRVQNNGFHLGAVFGWERPRALFGARLNADFTQMSREAGLPITVVGTNVPTMYTMGGDVKVMPFNYPTWRLYGLGGVNVVNYSNMAVNADAANGICNVDGKAGCYAVARNSLTRGGFNLGGGADFHVLSQEMFFETRFMVLQANAAQSWFVPVSFGLRYF